MPTGRRELLFLILGGFFLTNALLGEVTGGKLFVAPWSKELFGSEVILSIGVLMWPVVFITTDLVNEYFGKDGVKRLTWLGVAMISYAFLVLYLAIPVPTPAFGVKFESFKDVFGTSMWMIVGSLLAFITSQLLDMVIFGAFKARTGSSMLWLRATGSTVVSQLVDSYVVGIVGFVVPGKATLGQIVPVCGSNYLYKLSIAVLVTPVLYLLHGVIDRWLAGEAPPKPGDPADEPVV